MEADMIERDGAEPGIGQTQRIEVPGFLPPADRPALALRAAGRTYPVPQGRTVSVGRALDNDVILDHPSVSRHHARLSPRSGHWLVEDTDSTHGTYVNGRRIESCMLRSGDQLRFGSLSVLISDEADALP